MEYLLMLTEEVKTKLKYIYCNQNTLLNLVDESPLRFYPKNGKTYYRGAEFIIDNNLADNTFILE